MMRSRRRREKGKMRRGEGGEVEEEDEKGRIRRGEKSKK
jgi:hypothetical protein